MTSTSLPPSDPFADLPEGAVAASEPVESTPAEPVVGQAAPEAGPPEAAAATEPAEAVGAVEAVDAVDAVEAAAPSEAGAPTPAQTSARLTELFPALFKGQPKPLKLRIQVDIQERSPGEFSKSALSAFFRRYTGATSYLIAVSRGTHRFDLDGQEAGELTEEHRQVALDELTRRRAKQNERREQEETERRNRIQLLRDFETTELNEEAFCALKGITAEQLPGFLAQAKEDLKAAPPPRDDRRGGRGRPDPRGDQRRDPRGGRPGEPGMDRPQGAAPAAPSQGEGRVEGRPEVRTDVRPDGVVDPRGDARRADARGPGGPGARGPGGPGGPRGDGRGESRGDHRGDGRGPQGGPRAPREGGREGGRDGDARRDGRDGGRDARPQGSHTSHAPRAAAPATALGAAFSAALSAIKPKPEGKA